MLLRLILCSAVLVTSVAAADFETIDAKQFVSKGSLRVGKGIYLQPEVGSSLLPISTQEPLEPGYLYLRKKTGASKYAWYRGKPTENAFQELKAFNLASKGITQPQAMTMRLYGSMSMKPFQDESDIYFDINHVYSARVSTLYFRLGTAWESVPALDMRMGSLQYTSTVPAVVILGRDTVGKTPVTLTGMVPGIHSVTLDASSCLPLAVGLQVLPAETSRREVEMLCPQRLSQAPVLQQYPEPQAINAMPMEQLEDLSNRYQLSLDSMGRNKEELSKGFDTLYPPMLSAPPGVDEWADPGYLEYKELYLSTRKMAESRWLLDGGAQQQLMAVQQYVNHRLDSLESQILTVVLHPEVVRGEVVDSVTGRSRLLVKIRNEEGTIDASWTGTWVDSVPVDTIVAMLADSSARAQLRLTYQNRHARMRQGDHLLRRLYRFLKMELLLPGGVVREVAGEFNLPEYLKQHPEVQEWLATRNGQPSSKQVTEEDRKREEGLLKKHQQEEEIKALLKHRGPVVDVTGGRFRYKGKLVEISPFAIGATEVTQAHYGRVMHSQPSRQAGALRPMVDVTWDKAHEFCSALGGDLPSEAQWEYAARAGEASAPWTIGKQPPSVYAVSAVGSSKQHAPPKGVADVAGLKANVWGIYDMSGNVTEWTRDRYNLLSFLVEPKDPTGASFGHFRVIKGGSWKSDDVDEIDPSSSDYEDPRYWGESMGFRCVYPYQQELGMDSIAHFFQVRDSLATSGLAQKNKDKKDGGKGLPPVSTVDVDSAWARMQTQPNP